MDDNITTLPYGHYRLQAQVDLIGTPENEISIRSRRFYLPVSANLNASEHESDTSDTEDK